VLWGVQHFEALSLGVQFFGPYHTVSSTGGVFFSTYDI
jgi:hypothetical protein